MHHFSIKTLFSKAIELYTKHFWLLVLIAALQILVVPREHTVLPIKLLGVLAMVLLIFVSTKISIMIVDNKTIEWSKKDFFPTPHEYVKYAVLLIAVGVIVFGGVLLLVIPGIYFATRLQFATYAFIENGKAKVSESIASSWHLVTKEVFWRVLLVMVLVVLANFLGSLTFGIGMLLTGPVGTIMTALLYKELVLRAKAQKGDVVVQPIEIEAKPQETTTEEHKE